MFPYPRPSQHPTLQRQNTESGIGGSWSLPEIANSKDAVLALTGDIHDQAKMLSVAPLSPPPAASDSPEENVEL
jgi:hypothetical protein